MTEKERRIYYQSIVYDICNIVDQYNQSSLSDGVVCGTAENPTDELQELLKKILRTDS
ncbi:hypothetical protein KAR91_49700 [Candidatus Pacearchaeota archaeon]|nr:hypothetical protein [Candidatus Pacearchaeota archaeon]